MTGFIDGYKCTRCGKSSGHLWHENAEWIYLCGTQDCLESDAEITKEAARKKRQIEKQELDMTKLFGIGGRYNNASLSKLDINFNSQQMDIICNWIRNPKDSLVLLGSPGKGKTYFCCAIGNYFLSEGKSVFYCNTRRYFDLLQKTIQQNQNQYDQIEKIITPEFLIFDDIGASANTEWQKEVLFDLVDKRYSSNKPTIYTSNLSFEVMEKTLGERLTRRLNTQENTIIGMG